MTEQILVVETALLHPYIAGRCGLIRENLDAALSCIRSWHSFLPRPQAEEDPGYKQIIPYVVIRRGGQVFSTRRLSKGGEARLHGKISLGVGGHISAGDDLAGDDALMRGLYRELDEEVAFSRPHGEPRFLGLINDDSNDVGSVHLGLCFLLETDGEVAVRETEKLRGAWLELSELPALKEEMETWSSLLLDTLTEGA